MKVTILVPIYNVEQHIGQCATSLFAQTYPDIEYVFIDDCTPDASIDVLKGVIARYPERQPYIRIIHNDVNSGIGAVRAKALQEVNGQFFTFVDSDDVLPDDAIATLVTAMEKCDADIIDGAYCELKGDNNLSQPILPSHASPKRYWRMAMCQNKVSNRVWGRLYKRSVIDMLPDMFTPGIDYSEDYCAGARLSALTTRAWTDTVVYHYRIDNQQSYTKQISNANTMSYLRSNRKVLSFYHKRGHLPFSLEMGMLNAYRVVRNRPSLVDENMQYVPQHLRARMLYTMFHSPLPYCLTDFMYRLLRTTSFTCLTPFKGVGGQRVFHIISRLDIGGAERVAINIASNANEDNVEHHIVELMRARSPFTASIISELRKGNIRYHRSPLPVIIHWHYLFERIIACLFPLRMLWLWLRYHPDVIHSHTEMPDMAVWLSLRVMPFINVKVVRTIHNTSLWQGLPSIGKHVERFMQQHKANIAISPYVSDAYMNAYGQRPEVIYNGMSPSKQQPYDGIIKGKINICFAGRFEKQKGIDVLCNIVKAMANDDRFHFHIFGSGRMQPLVDAELKGLKNVTVMPPLHNIASYMASFDLLIMPSRHEGLSLLAIEAALNGLPIAINHCAGLADVLPPSWPLTVTDNDIQQWLHILQDVLPHTSLTQLQASARDYATRHYSLQQMQQQYNNLYSNL